MKFKMSFGAALALFSFACAEQNAAANSASGENLGDIEVVERANNDDGYRAIRSEIGKTTKRILEIPQTVNVVTQQHLKDKKPETLAEALQKQNHTKRRGSKRAREHARRRAATGRRHTHGTQKAAV